MSLGSTTQDRKIKAELKPVTLTPVDIIDKLESMIHVEKEYEMPSKQKRRLRIFNASLFLFHTCFTVATFLVGKIDLQVDIFSLTVAPSRNISDITDYRALGLEVDDNLTNNFLSVKADPNPNLSLYFTWLTASFFMLSAFFHFGNAFLWFKSYIYYLERQMSPFRWIEYTFSASIMILAIAYGAGVLVDIELFMLFILIATTMFFGHLTESINKKKPNEDKWQLPLWNRLVPHLLGYVPQISAWAVILYVFLTNDGDPPPFVLPLILTELVLFFSFGFVQLVVLCRNPSKYVQGEVAYQVLSLVSKGSLGLILFTNVLFLSNWQCLIEEVREKLPEDYC